MRVLNNNIYIFLIISLSSIMLSGCGVFYRANWKEFHNAYHSGNYNYASQVVMPTEPPQPDQTLDETLGLEKALIGFESGNAAFFSGNFDHSIKLLDISENVVLGRSDWTNYKPKYYETIMMNTYKGLAFWAKGDINNARVEFNRVPERQSQAVQENASMVNKEINKAIQESYQSVENAFSAISNEYGEFANFKPYADFTNPFSTYIVALFNILIDRSHFENGVNYLRRVASMVPQNSYLVQDFYMAQNIGLGNKPEPTVWVIYEEGLFPKIDVQKIQVPFLTSSGLKIANLSLPKFQSNEHSYVPINIRTSEGVYQTQLLSDMERIMKTEFNASFPGEVAKAVTWMVVNLVAQEVSARYINKKASKHGGLIGKLGKSKVAGSLAAGAISQITNDVETRTWSTLAKEIHLARFKMPFDRLVHIDGLASVRIEPHVNYAMIYVRSPKKTAKPGVFVFDLKSGI